MYPYILPTSKTNLQIMDEPKYLELIFKDPQMYEDFQIMNTTYGDFIFARDK